MRGGGTPGTLGVPSASGNDCMSLTLPLAGIKDDVARFCFERIVQKFPIQTADIDTAQVTEAKVSAGSTGLAKGSFSSYRNAALSLATGAVVTFDAEEWDVSGWHDITTNKGRFTPLVAGYYRLSAGVRAGAALTTTAKFWAASIYKNGASAKLGDIATGSTGTAPQGIVDGIVKANGTTDYFEIVLAHNEVGSIALTVGADQTYFQGELIGRS